MNEDNKQLILWGSIIIISFLLLGILVGVTISNKKTTCENFGGKITTSLNECYKSGITYDLVSIDFWGFNYRISRKAISMEYLE